MNFICVYYNPLARFQTEIKGKRNIKLHRLHRLFMNQGHTVHRTASDRQTDKGTKI